MSDVSLYQKGASFQTIRAAKTIVDKSILTASVRSASPRPFRHTLTCLPYDVLLCIARSLDVADVISLEATCRLLREFTTSRSLCLHLVSNMLCRSQPLPTKGFQRISDLGTKHLFETLKRGFYMQEGWHTRRPHLLSPSSVIEALKGESIVWLSPITSKYTLLCLSSGEVICWDVPNSASVASWHAGEDWELWKCRVEFDESTVYFAMAKRATDGIGTDCQIMALSFPEELNGSLSGDPSFKQVCCITLPGHVIAVYLLNPPQRLLSAYIWLASMTLGLYVLLDWDTLTHVFLDTGISCLSGNEKVREWSCIGYDPSTLVIHDEDHDELHQYFYPMDFLYAYSTTPTRGATITFSTGDTGNPSPPQLIAPPHTVTLKFTTAESSPTPFDSYVPQSSHFVRQWWPTLPNMTDMKRSSCTVVLLSFDVPGLLPALPEEGQDVENAPGFDHPPTTRLYTIAQHYFSIPAEEAQMRWWYVREPFELVNAAPTLVNRPDVGHLPTPPPDVDYGAAPQVQQQEEDEAIAAYEEVFFALEADAGVPILDPPAPDGAEEGEAQPVMIDHDHLLTPLIAVDFGCAAWLAYASPNSDHIHLCFVMFPPVDVDRRSSTDFDPYASMVQTLQLPDELDLGNVCHIGVDQSQGTIILGFADGTVHVVYYA